MKIKARPVEVQVTLTLSKVEALFLADALQLACGKTCYFSGKSEERARQWAKKIQDCCDE